MNRRCRKITPMLLVPVVTSMAAEAALPRATPVSSSSPSIANSMPWRGALREFLMIEVDPNLSTIQLAAYCFMAG
jgi:hypothetical protein